MNRHSDPISHGATETDDVRVTVNFFLTGSTEGGSGCTVSGGGRFAPLWLILILTGVYIRSRQKLSVKKY